MTNLTITSVRPDSFILTDRYSNFTYTLPVDFVAAGNPQIKSYLAYYDDDNLEAVQFKFTNGQSEITTELYGKP